MIQIEAPKLHEVDYVDRHGNHSINAMLLCGPDNVFYYACVRWPGSVHDNRILKNSSLYRMFEIEGKLIIFYSFN